MSRMVSVSAEDFLDLISKVCGLDWRQRGRIKRMPHCLLNGHVPIYEGGKPMEEDVITYIPGVMQRFNKLLDDIYRGIYFDVYCSMMSERWRRTAYIIILGKERGLSRADWSEALSKKI